MMLHMPNAMAMGGAEGTGQQAYTTPGSYSFVVPENVNRVSVLLVGGGGSGARSDNPSTVYAGGGAGGASVYGTFDVVPGNTIQVVVGAGGASRLSQASGQDGGTTTVSLNSVLMLRAAGGEGGRTDGNPTDRVSGQVIGSGITSTGVGLGGAGHQGSTSLERGGGGGGAAGYNSFGGDGGISGGSSGSGGGGAGGNGLASVGGSGGGVGLLGQGANGVGSSADGGGGSGGGAGSSSAGGAYGGGGGGGMNANSAAGGSGAVRIIWGVGRAYPATLTGDL